MTAALTAGVGAAYAGNPPSPTLNTYPRWYTGQVESIRNAGSDTIFFLTQTMADYFEQSGLYGCNLNSAVSPDYSQCIVAPGDVTATTDVTDNYDHTEITVGLGKIGSGDGQQQLCGLESAEFPVDYSRSSKPPSASSNGCTDTAGLVGLGFAKDGVPSVDFPDASGPGTATSEFPNVTGSAASHGRIVGPVAAGWLPGDPVTCNTGTPNTSSNPLNRTSNAHVGILANSCSGVPLESMDNNDPITVQGQTGTDVDTAYGIWCQTGGTGAGQITDWGQLTNLTGSELPGEGTSIGVPITVVGVNTGSGTEATFLGFVNPAKTSGGCSSNVDSNGYNPGGGLDAETGVLENNSAQIGSFADDDFTGSDTTQFADQAALVATSLYFISNGVYNSNIHARIVTLSNGTEYAANKMLENEVVPTTTQTGTLMENTYPTARTLYNVYRPDTVRDSVASFLNWICDANNVFQKGVDLYTGKNYDTELTTAINTTYGFIRLTDTTASPNNSCQLINIAPAATDASGSSGNPVLTSAGNMFEQANEPPVVPGDAVFGTNIPAGDHVSVTTTVSAGSITLQAAPTGTVSGVTFGLANVGCNAGSPGSPITPTTPDAAPGGAPC